MRRPTRSFTPRFLAAAATAALPGVALADVSYAFVFGDPSDSTHVGSSIHSDGALRLTTDSDQAGAFWHQVPQRVDSGFVTTFNFQIEPGPGNVVRGDGFAFVIQPNSDAELGAGGSGIGYDGISSSLAIEIDTFAFSGEVPAAHVAVHTQGLSPNSSGDTAAVAAVELSTLGISISDFQNIKVTIQYIPDDGTTPAHLDVYFENQLVLTTNVDLTDIGGEDITNAGEAYVGFTAGTGLADSSHVITSWAFDDDTTNDFTNPACLAPYWHVFSSGGGGGIGGSYGADVTVVGTHPMTYQWYKNGVPITDDDGGRILGFDSRLLQINDFLPSDQDYYSVTISNACGTASGLEVFLGPCPADLDDGSATGTKDGGVDISDLLYFLALFDLGDLGADMDDGGGFGVRDQAVDISDLLFFLARFDEGC